MVLHGGREDVIAPPLVLIRSVASNHGGFGLRRGESVVGVGCSRREESVGVFFFGRCSGWSVFFPYVGVGSFDGAIWLITVFEVSNRGE